MTTTLATLIASADRGDECSARALFTALYTELHQIARRELARAGGMSPLGATTLLHEAYLNISGRDTTFPNRARFMAYAARVMRGIIIDQLRSQRAEKRGGRFEFTTLDTGIAEQLADASALGDLSDALDELSGVDASLSEIVDLKFFCGFTFAEVAALRGISERTVQRDWEKARIYLHRALNEPRAHGRHRAP